MTTIHANPPANSGNPWSGIEKTALRFFSIYFLLLAVPLDWKYYRDHVFVNWSDFHFAYIFNLAHYTPRFVDGPDTFLNWGIVALIAIAGTIAWSIVGRRQTNFDSLYYYVRVILRYRLAIALLAYGFLKFFPMQSPEPSISNLNTNYGDLSDWKMFSLSLGIVPSFQSFLGLVEIISGLLLLYRRTASIGAFIVLAFTGNVVMSNLAYEGGEVVYSLYLVSIAAFLLAFDLNRLIRLLALERPTAPNRYHPAFTSTQKKLRLALKSAFVFVFVLWYGYATYDSYRHDTYKYPARPGLAGASGIYNVKTFVLAGDTIAYSRTHATRWKDVVFEKWATLSIRSNRPVITDHTNVEIVPVHDRDRTYELEGDAGRHYYAYDVQDGNTLALQNRNKAYPNEKLSLRFTRPDEQTIVLDGTNEDGVPVHVVLEKLDKKYLLDEARKAGRRNGLKL